MSRNITLDDLNTVLGLIYRMSNKWNITGKLSKPIELRFSFKDDKDVFSFYADILQLEDTFTVKKEVTYPIKISFLFHGVVIIVDKTKE